MLRIHTPHFAVVTAVLFVGGLAGCSNSSDPADMLAKANETNLQRLSNLYAAFQSEHNWRGPADEQQFKNFLKSYNSAKLTRIGIDPVKIDDLFVSERDSQPFKIRYGVPGSIRGSTEPVVFEATGKGGNRLIGFLNMEQREVDEAEYQSLWAGAASTASSGPGIR